MKGKFIVIEGIDGCGKTTQIKELSKWLPKSGLLEKDSQLITTREPGGSLLGKKLRELILDNNEKNKPSSIPKIDPETDDEKRRYDRAKKRHLIRKKNRIS